MSIPQEATPERRADWLRPLDPWRSLPEPALQAVAAAMRPALFAAGAVIIRHGEPGRHLHVLTGGEADVRVHVAGGRAISVATVRAGACVGEMSLLSGDLTSADVVATIECATLALDRSDFDALVAAQPGLLRDFVRMVSGRLRDSNVAVDAAQQKEKHLTRFLQEAGAEACGELVGGSPAVRAAQRQIDALAAGDGPVLIEGEPGTGKELAARLIHFRGTRRDAPLLRADCAQIAETPWGDKLFGDYHGGSASDGGPPAISYLDLASGGTIVLKDVERLPRSLQDRLAAFLSTGAQGPAGLPVRVIATCRHTLGDLAAAGRVSPALATAFRGRTLAIPPLRERKRDIAALAAHFIRTHADRLGKPVPRLGDEALSRLVTYDYPHGNVRELEEAIQRAVILTDGDEIDGGTIFLGRPPSPSRWAFNLLALPRAAVGAGIRVFPRMAQALVAAAFAVILYGCLAAPASAVGRWSVALVWSAWWPALALSFFFVGRAWCAVCPMALAGGVAQRVVNPGGRVPAWLKRHDLAITMAGFFAIVWAEEATAMRHSPRATGLLLLSILVGAVVTAALLPRRAWCRHLCPLGGIAGVCSMAGMVELRPTPDICAAKCRDHLCFKGSQEADGCPMFNHVMFVDSNQDCVLCLQCVRACPNDSPRLNARLPATELLSPSGDRRRAARLAALLAGLLAGMMAIQIGEGGRAGALGLAFARHRVLWVTALLAAGAILPQAVLWKIERVLGCRADPGASGRFWERVAAWVPAVAAGFACYHLAFIPGFALVRVAVGTAGTGGRAVSAGLLPLTQATLFGAGLAATIIVLWKQRREAGSRSGPGSGP